MELYRVKPYSFESLFDMIDLHLVNVCLYLNRMFFTEQDYLHHSVPFNLHTLRRLLVVTTFNWSVIAIILLAYCRIVPQFSVFTQMLEQTLHMKRIDIFYWTYLMAFIIIEYSILFSFYTQARYEDTKLNVFFEFRATLDYKLKPCSKRELIRYFVRNTYLAGLCNKALAIGLAFFAIMLCRTALQLYFESRIDIPTLLTGLYISFAVHLSFFYALYNVVVLMTGLFLFFKIFQMSMTKCLAFLKIATLVLENRSLIVNFHQEYMSLHRQINFANFSVREYNLCLDAAFKSAGTLAIIFMWKQDHLNVYSYLFILCYSLIYLYATYVLIKLAYFPAKNYICYKYMADFAANVQARKRKHLNLLSDVKFYLKLNFMVQFLSNNRMGFGMGRRFFITKTKVIEEMMLNLYMLVLVYKRINF